MKNIIKNIIAQPSLLFITKHIRINEKKNKATLDALLQ
jgi:hypothetical protein